MAYPLLPRFRDSTTALCPYHDDAAALFHRWFSDDELITRMGDWDFLPVPYGESAEEYVKRTRRTTWLICALGDDTVTPIGYTGIHVKQRHRVGVFRIAIPEVAYRRQGHAYRATNMFNRWAFRHLDLLAIHLSVTSSNGGAIALYRRCGFVECGRYAQSRHEPDGRHDEIHMELLKSTWEQTEALRGAALCPLHT